MAWTYHDFESQTDASAKLTRLELHQSEVRAVMSADLAHGDKSRGTSPLLGYLRELETRRKQLQAEVRAAERTSTRRRFVAMRCTNP